LRITLAKQMQDSASFNGPLIMGSSLVLSINEEWRNR
jgi:hypothetical protein